MQNQSKFIIFISVIVIAVVLLMNIQVTIKTQDYGTGLTANTTSNYETISKGWDAGKNSVVLRATSPQNEIFVNPMYVVSWQSQTAKSQLITSRADFIFNNRGRYTGWGSQCGYLYGAALQFYYVSVDYTDTSGKVTNIINTKENIFNYNYIQLARVAATTYHAGQGYEWPNAQYKSSIQCQACNGGQLSCHQTYDKWSPYWYPGGNSNVEQSGDKDIHTDTMEFYMIGSHVGKLTIHYYLNSIYRSRDTNNIGEQANCNACYWEKTDDILIATDECYLAAGDGSINILSTNAIPGSGTTAQVQHSNEKTTETYTKYVYEEGQTVRISVDTGYSGESLKVGDTGPDGNPITSTGPGWFLNIYGPDGILKSKTTLDDNLAGKIVDYNIPTGSFVPGSENTFRVELTNTLFKQAETRLFVVKAGAISGGLLPGKPTVKILDKDGNEVTKFTQGDRVYIQATAQSNPKGDTIDHFKAWATYLSPSGTRYAYPETNIIANKIGNATYTCTFSFMLSSDIPDIGNVYIQVHAIDAIGQAGPEWTGNIYSQQLIGAYRITIQVATDGTPVSGATCVFTKEDGTTTTRVSDSDGNALFGLDGGMWNLKVSKSGYYDAQINDILVKDNGAYPVNLKPMWFPFNYGLLIIIIIIVIVGVIVTLELYLRKRGLSITDYLLRKQKVRGYQRETGKLEAQKYFKKRR